MVARPFKVIAALGVVAALIVGGAVFAALRLTGRPSADVTLSLSDLSVEEVRQAYRPETSVLRFAVAAVNSPRATLENYQLLAQYLGKRLGRPAELIQGKSYAEINALVRSGDVSLALVCSGAFVVGRQDFGMQLLAMPVVNGESTYHSYLIVPSPSNVQDWEGLRQKTFAFTDPLSNSGRLVPIYVLWQRGETPERFFRDYIFTYAHDKSVQAVADGLVDGAAVDSLVYDHLARNDPSIAARTRIVWRSPPYGINPVVVHPNLDPELRQQLEAILLDMDADPEGQRVLAQLGTDRFVRPDTGAYDSIEAMLRATAGR